MQSTLNSKMLDAAATTYAEAWREKNAAEARLKDATEAFKAVLASGTFRYSYSDGVAAEFKLTTGSRKNPVSFAEAKELTGFGEANMARIAGNVDADAVEAMVKLGKLDAAVAAKLVPSTPYEQIRGYLKK